MLRSTILLTASGIAAKSVDFIFRAFYSRQLGGEGMGIFSLCFSVHSIMLNLATGGFGVAVSKLVSEQYASGKIAETKKTMQYALGFVFVLSIVSILCACLFSKQIAQGFLKEPRCRYSIICISPSVMFMGISYCIKGYFYAVRRVAIPASSEFLEQAVKIMTITYLLSKMLKFGVEYGCMAVFLGLSIGEFSSCLYLFVFYVFYAKRNKTINENRASVLASMLKISLPIMATSLAGAFLRMQEEVITVAALKKSGLEQTAALSLYGGVRGMVMPLIVFPLTLLSSCFTLLVPEISRAFAIKNDLRLKTLVTRVYRFCSLLGFLVWCVFWVFGDKLIALVYKAPQFSVYAKAIAVITPMMFLDSVSCGILNGMGKQPRLLCYSLADSLGRLVLIYFLMPRYGINALIFIIIASNLFTFLLTYSSVIRFSGIGVYSVGRIWRYVAAMMLAVFISGSLFFGASTTKDVILGIAATKAIYFSASVVFGAAAKGDLRWFISRMLISG